MPDTAAKLQLSITQEFEFTAEALADAFCQLSDHAQAAFFVEAGRIMSEWDTPAGRSLQAFAIGQRLSGEHGTFDARELIGDIHRSIEGDEDSFWKVALAWQKQGARSKWSTPESLALWDLVESMKRWRQP
jgi:hypothetical protein